MVKKNSKKSNVKKQSIGVKKVTSKKIIDDLNLQIKNEKESTEKHLDRYKRLLAEFDNYKRRTSEEKSNISKIAITQFSKEIITVIDDFDRTLDVSPKVKTDDAYIKGVLFIYEKLNKILLDQEIKSFGSIGEKFDPEIHEAISSQEDDTKENGIVINEYLKGYKYKEKIIRHSQVIVIKNKK